MPVAIWDHATAHPRASPVESTRASSNVLIASARGPLRIPSTMRQASTCARKIKDVILEKEQRAQWTHWIEPLSISLLLLRQLASGAFGELGKGLRRRNDLEFTRVAVVLEALVRPARAGRRWIWHRGCALLASRSRDS
jgi:hypothetical protein